MLKIKRYGDMQLRTLIYIGHKGHDYPNGHDYA